MPALCSAAAESACPAPAAAAGGYGFDLGDLFGAGSGGSGGRLGDLLGGVFGSGGGRTTTADQAEARRGRGDRDLAGLQRRDRGRRPCPLRLANEGACKACAGTGAKSGTVPRVCPSCEGTGQESRNLGSFAFSEPCKECRGRGLIVDDPCPECAGSGRAMSTRTIQARIPAGVGDGQRIKLKGKGAPGERGGPPGDLYVRVHVSPHPVFGRSGHNLTLTVPVTFPEATLGAEIKVPSHRGMPVSLRIPAGTPNGRTFRVRGKGVRRADATYGDLLVTVNVQVPQKVNRQARDALETFRDATAGAGPAGRAAAQGQGRMSGVPVRGDDMTSQFELSDDTPVYVISVAAQLSGLHPQTLRAYDRLGLVSPGRTAGRGRRYSLRDILILREVQRLSQEEGVNLQGIKRILELESQEQRSRPLLAELHAEISQLRAELESTRAVAARLAGLLQEPQRPRCPGADPTARERLRPTRPGSTANTRAHR